MSRLLIENGTLVSDGLSRRGYLMVEGDRIVAVGEGDFVEGGAGFKGERIDASGMLVMPGVIDDHVHFREPGMVHKGDMASESLAAVAGGVTSIMDMPNTNPPTTTLERIEDKFELAAERMLTNHSFYLGATNSNIDEIRRVDPRRVCGVKLFMGSSTGNMLVDRVDSLESVFAESPTLIAAHCENESMIRANAELYRSTYGERVDSAMHPLIRTAEACYRSSAEAVEMAERYQSNLHIMHLSTERELSLFSDAPIGQKRISCEVSIHHLWFSDEDYALKGEFIKWNPAIKSVADRDALRLAIGSGRIDMIGTDHAPHTKEEKMMPYWSAPSGGPMVQHSLVAMLELSRRGVLSVEQVVERMCHAPAIRFAIKDRGFLREGAYADIVVVKRDVEWEVAPENILYKCGWSALEGERFRDRVEYTIVGGRIVNRRGEIETKHKGVALEFER